MGKGIFLVVANCTIFMNKLSLKWTQLSHSQNSKHFPSSYQLACSITPPLHGCHGDANPPRKANRKGKETGKHTGKHVTHSLLGILVTSALYYLKTQWLKTRLDYSRKHSIPCKLPRKQHQLVSGRKRHPKLN